MTATSPSDTPSPAALPPTSETDSGGFKSFWKKPDRKNQPGTLTFVAHDAPSKRKSRIKHLLGRSDSSPDDGKSLADSPNLTNAQRRRMQVYEAQKRHRSRKAGYIEQLEEELTRLQQLDAEANGELNMLTHQNLAIKQFLASAHLDPNLELRDLSFHARSSRDLSPVSCVTLGVRYDPHMGHQRTFMSEPGLSPRSFGTHGGVDEPTFHISESGSDLPISTDTAALPSVATTTTASVKSNSWAALDFILALEWPCQGHTGHHGINPCGNNPGECESGHALTMTSAVYQSACPADPPYLPAASDSTGKLQPQSEGLATIWQLPISEIDKLIRLSENLELDVEQITPAQAFSAIRNAVSTDAQLQRALDLLKDSLGAAVQCLGFGAVIPAKKFWQHLTELSNTLGAQ